MGWNDLPLSAAASANAKVGVTGPATTSTREADADSSFEHELRLQSRSAAPSALQDDTTAASASAVITEDVSGTESPSAETAASDSPADWLALINGLRANAATKTSPTEPVSDGEQLVTPMVTDRETLAETAPNSLQTAPDAQEIRESMPGGTLDAALLPPPAAILTVQPQPVALSPTVSVPSLGSQQPDLLVAGQRQPQAALQEPGELDGHAARKLAAAVPEAAGATARLETSSGLADSVSRTTATFSLSTEALPATTEVGAGAAERIATDSLAGPVLQATAAGTQTGKPEFLQPAETPAQRHLATPMGQRGWDQAVSQQVSWLVRDQIQSASLSLNPPHLGPVQITLQLDQQQATVHFASAVPEVRRALEDALPVLRQMLGESGINLGQADVGSRQPERDNPAFQRQTRRQDTVTDEPVEAALQPRTSGSGLLNLFA